MQAFRQHRGVVHLRFPDQLALTHAMMRMQEFYESPIPGVRGEFFSRQKFEDAYALANPEAPCYYTAWNGFNIPGRAVQNWASLFTPDPEEAAVLRAVQPEFLGERPFYVIATHREGDIDHELSHAFYHLDDLYRYMAKRLLDGLQSNMPSAIAALTVRLMDWGYSRDVLDDELVAYIGTSPLDYLLGRCGLPLATAVALRSAGEGINGLLAQTKVRLAV